MSSNDDLQHKNDLSIAPEHHKDADSSWNFRNVSQNSSHNDARRSDRALIYWRTDDTLCTGGIQTTHTDFAHMVYQANILQKKILKRLEPVVLCAWFDWKMALKVSVLMFTKAPKTEGHGQIGVRQRLLTVEIAKDAILYYISWTSHKCRRPCGNSLRCWHLGDSGYDWWC